jgi:hypothetical protein
VPDLDDEVQLSLKNDLISKCFSQRVKIGRRSDSQCACFRVLGKFFKNQDSLENEAELTDAKREGLRLKNIASITFINDSEPCQDLPS